MWLLIIVGTDCRSALSGCFIRFVLNVIALLCGHGLQIRAISFIRFVLNVIAHHCGHGLRIRAGRIRFVLNVIAHDCGHGLQIRAISFIRFDLNVIAHLCGHGLQIRAIRIGVILLFKCLIYCKVNLNAVILRSAQFLYHKKHWPKQSILPFRRSIPIRLNPLLLP